MTNDYGTILTKTSRSPEATKAEQLHGELSVIIKQEADDVLRCLDQKLRFLFDEVIGCKISIHINRAQLPERFQLV